MALTSARRLPRHVEEDLPEEYYDNFKDLITKPQLLDGIAEANIRYLYTPQMVFVKASSFHQQKVCWEHQQTSRTGPYLKWRISLQSKECATRDDGHVQAFCRCLNLFLKNLC